MLNAFVLVQLSIKVLVEQQIFINVGNNFSRFAKTKIHPQIECQTLLMATMPKYLWFAFEMYFTPGKTLKAIHIFVFLAGFGHFLC